MAMTGTTSPAAFGSLFRRVTGIAGASLMAVWQAHFGRRAVSRLLDFDDRMLQDMGITRGDVHAAMASRVTDDPSLHLAALAHERRAAALGQAREKRQADKISVL